MSAGRIRQGGVFVEIGADASQFFTALNKVQKEIGKIGQSVASVGSRMMGVGAAVAAPILASAQAFANVGSALNDMSQRTGVAAEALSVLKFAAEQTGTDMGSVETAVKKMQKAIFAAAGGSKEAADALASVGLSAADLAGLSADQQMAKIADGLMAIEDPGARAAIAMQIFGKSGTMILPMLEGGSAGMAAFAAQAARLGLIMDNETAAKADTLGDAIDALKASMAMAFVQVGSAVAPILAGIAQKLAVVAAVAGKFISSNQQLVVNVLKFGAALIAGGSVLFAFGKTVTAFSASLSVLGVAISAVVSPFSALMAMAVAIGGAFASSVGGVLKLGNSIGSSMASAVVAVSRFASQSASQLAGFAASGARSVLQFGSAMQGVFASQFRIARFIGQTFGQSLATAFSKTAMSLGPIRAAVMGIGPALSFVAKGFAALAADAAQMAAPLTQPFVKAAGSVATFATGVASSVAAYLSSIATAVAASVTGNAKIATAWLGSALKAVGAFVSGVATGVATYIGSIAGAVAASVGAAAGIAGAWLATAFPATAAFVSQAVASLATYVASSAAALASSVTSAAGIAVAWVSSGMPGLVTFVGTAVAGIATYLGSCAAAVAGSVASAAGIAAAWLAPVAPILAIGAALAGIGVLAYQFGGQIKGALGGIGELAGQAGSAIGSAFTGVVQDATVVFGDLYQTGKTTFNGIYEAIAAGDLSSAMDILWAGLQAGWLRGVEALMGYVDPWVALLQNTFTYAGTGIATTWESMWSGMVQGANTIGAVVMGVVDNLVNGVMAAFDAMVAAVRKSWNWVQSFIVDGYDLAEENQKVDSEMAARARQREAARPGVSGRMDRAARENAATARDTQGRIDAMNQAAEETAAGRLASNDARAADRRAATKAAEDRVTSMTRAASDRRAFRSQADDVIGQFGTASSMGQIQELADEFHALAETGHLTEQQMQAFSDAVDNAQERVTAEGSASGGAARVAPVDPKAIADAAAAAAASQAEVAGTFSAQAVGGMGFGQSLAQKQLDALNKIEHNTRNDDAGAVAA